MQKCDVIADFRIDSTIHFALPFKIKSMKYAFFFIRHNHNLFSWISRCNGMNFAILQKL